MTKKLIFITNNFPPLSCGVGDYTYYLSKEFVIESYDVTVICQTNAEIAAYWQDSKEKMTLLPIGGKWNKADWEKVFLTIEKISPDYVLLQYVPGSYHHHAIPLALTTFVKKLKKLPAKLLTTFHETYVRYNWSHPKYIYLALAQRLIARAVAKNSDYIITSIDRYKNQLNKFNKNIKIIPIGSNIPPLPIDKSELLKLRQNIAPNSEFILSTFGNRDHNVLIDLFSELVEKKPGIILVIIGKSNILTKNLPQNIKNKLFITGYLKADEVYKFLKISDAFIMLDYVSKKGDGGTCNKSGSLAAGIAAELPIFGTMGDMTNKLLLKDDVITFIDYHDVVKSAEIILQFLGNKALMKKKSLISQVFYNNYLRKRKIIKGYKSILKINQIYF